MKSKLLTALLAASLFFVGSTYAANAYAVNNRVTYQNAGSYQAHTRELVALTGTLGMSSSILAIERIYNNGYTQHQLRYLAASGEPDMHPEFVAPFIIHFGRWVWIFARNHWPKILSFLIFSYNHGPDFIEAVKEYFSDEDIDDICDTYEDYHNSNKEEPDGYNDNDGYDEEEYDIDDDDEKNLGMLCHGNP